jgi:hypothetical protein
MMKPRYYPRVAVQGSAVFTVGGFTGKGQVLDLTVPGCLIDSPLVPNKGDSLVLRMNLPQEGVTFRVARGVVRWVLGTCFGVEFIEMDQRERVRYNTTVSNLLHHQAARRSRPDKSNYSRQQGGVNWHREEYGVSTTPLTISRAGTGRRTS